MIVILVLPLFGGTVRATPVNRIKIRIASCLLSLQRGNMTGVLTLWKEKMNPHPNSSASGTSASIFLLLSLLLIFSSVRSETRWGWVTLFPQQRLVSTFSANPVAHQFSAGQILKNRNIPVSFGGTFPVFNIQEDWFRAQLSLGSSVYALLKPSEEVNLISTDFYVDFLIIDIPLTEEFTLRITPGHTSHHLSDEAFETSGLGKSMGYVRDYWAAFGVYRSEVLGGFFYGGVYYSYTYRIDQEIKKPWLFEIGGEFLRTRVTEGIIAYGGIDIRLREESNFATTQNYQAGVRFLNGNSYSIRLAVTFRSGVDERGQFIRRHDRWVMLGGYIDV